MISTERIEFKNIPYGEYFYFKAKYYIKIRQSYLDPKSKLYSAEGFNAIDVRTGDPLYCHPDTFVVNATQERIGVLQILSKM